MKQAQTKTKTNKKNKQEYLFRYKKVVEASSLQEALDKTKKVCYEFVNMEVNEQEQQDELDYITVKGF